MSRNGKLLGKILLPVFDTPDGNHGALWRKPEPHHSVEDESHGSRPVPAVLEIRDYFDG